MQVAITGWALRTPLGKTVRRVVDRLLAGEGAAEGNRRFPIDSYACRVAAPIVDEPGKSPHGRVLRRIELLGVEAALEALRHGDVPTGERFGLFSAIGGLRAHWTDLMPALAGQGDDLTDPYNRGFKRLHPFWMLQHLSNNAHALLAADVGAKGDGVTFGGANAGAQALVSAIHALEVGAVDAALVVAYDSLLEPETLVEMAARRALTVVDVDALRAPYDENANGMVPGEAAAAVVLERTDTASPGILSRVQAADSADGGKQHADAATVGRVATRLAEGDEVVDGCSLARPRFDAEERTALRGAVSESARLISIQAAMGNLGAATSVVQAIVLSALLRERRLPPIAGLCHAAPGPLLPVERTESTRATSALGLCAGAPGLVGAVRVELPR